MKSILLVIKSNYKKRKAQYLLIAVILGLAALLSGVAGGLLLTMHQPFDKTFDNLNASHLLLFPDIRSYDAVSIREWFRHQPEVKRVGTGNPFVMHEGPLIHKDKKIDVMIQLTERSHDNYIQDMLMTGDSILKIQPGYGEIWIPNYLSDNYNIKIGDSLGISVPSGFYHFKVSAIVVDPHYSSGMINPTRAWIAPGGLSLFFPPSEITQTMITVRLDDVSSSNKLWLRFNKKFRFTGTMLQYSLFKSAFLSLYQIISAILILFSVMAFLVAFYLIGSTIKGAIHSDYKTIGIYKVMGFTPGRLVLLLIIQFGIIAILVIPVSLFTSGILLKVVIGMLTRSLGIVRLDYQLFWPYTIVGIGILGMVLLVCLKAGRQAAKVIIVDAVRYGLPVKSLNIQKNKFDLGNSSLPVSFALGIKLLIFNIRRSGVTFISVLLTVFILIFSLNIAFSFSRLKENKPAWGFDNGDIQLSRNTHIALPLTHEQLIEFMGNEKEVQSCIPYSYYSLILLTPGGEPLNEIHGRAYFDRFSLAGLKNMEGSHPERKNEIALCAGTMRDIGKQPGDSVFVFLEGQSKYFIVTGVYQDVSNMGQGFRVPGLSILESNPLFKPSSYSLILKNGTNTDQFKNHLQSSYGETIRVELSIDERIALMGIISKMQTSLMFLSFIFLMVLIISIWNDNIVHVREQQKNFGILKVIGFTCQQLRLALIYRNMIIAVGAMILGLPLALWGSPLLMSVFTGGIGLIRFPFLINCPGSLLVLLTIILFSFGVTWLSSGKLKRMQTRFLIRE